VIGGSALPWLAGTLTQSEGMGALVPFCLVLGALLGVVWWRLAKHVPQVLERAPSAPGVAAALQE
jgi:hypothetical protein